MYNSSLLAPKSLSVYLPEKSTCVCHNEPFECRDRSLNLIIDKDAIYWYRGKIRTSDSIKINKINLGSKDLRKLLLFSNKEVVSKLLELKSDLISGRIDISEDSLSKIKRNILREDTYGSIVFIKALPDSKYGSFVDVIDEMQICNISRYNFADFSYLEMDMLNSYKILSKFEDKPIEIKASRLKKEI